MTIAINGITQLVTAVQTCEARCAEAHTIVAAAIAAAFLERLRVDRAILVVTAIFSFPALSALALRFKSAVLEAGTVSATSVFASWDFTRFTFPLGRALTDPILAKTLPVATVLARMHVASNTLPLVVTLTPSSGRVTVTVAAAVKRAALQCCLALGAGETRRALTIAFHARAVAAAAHTDLVGAVLTQEARLTVTDTFQAHAVVATVVDAGQH